MRKFIFVLLTLLLVSPFSFEAAHEKRENVSR